MFLLVVRQGRLPRRVWAAVTSPCRPQSLARLACTPTLRSYANQSNESSKSSKSSQSSQKKAPNEPNKVEESIHSNKSTPDNSRTQVLSNNSAIIVPTSVADIQHEHVLPHISPVSRQRWASETFAVFLVTPSFAPWLYDNAFLEKAVRKLYPFDTSSLSTQERSDLRVHALCAVVDKLPAASTIKENNPLGDKLPQRTQEPPVSETGFEGVAYATLTADASVPSATQSPSGNGAIDFLWSNQTFALHHHTDTLRLPLANTVFQTGTPSTMTFSTWILPANSDQLVLDTKENVFYHGIKADGRDSVDQIVTSLSIPLIPLTFPRQVEGCMGNIIRQLIGPGGEFITASSELERVVPQFFKSRGEPAQATSAWALVMSTKLRRHVTFRTWELLGGKPYAEELETDKFDDNIDLLWERLWKSDPPLWNKMVSSALAQGARLHRVLSGGGGWGKKAGLLSLDPVPMTEESDEDLTSASDRSENFSSVLTPVVRDRDWIQFFISPTSTPKFEALKLEKLGEVANSSKTGVWSWELGCIPSTMDSLPGGSWQHTTPSNERRVVAFKGSFGALTEKGLTFTRRSKVSMEDSTKVVRATTVDVPFSRFSAVMLEKEKPSECSAKKLLTTMTREDLAGSTFVDVRKKKKTTTLRIPKYVTTYRDAAKHPSVKISRPKSLCIRKLYTPSLVTPRIETSGRLPILKPTSTPIFTSRTATDSYNRTSRIVSRLTEECRAIMSTIRRRKRQQLRLIRDSANKKRYSMRGKSKSSTSRPRDRAERRELRQIVFRQVVDEKERPRKDEALRTFRGKRIQGMKKELEERVGGWLSGGS